MPPTIGIIGRARSGKDTVAAHLVAHHGYVRLALADPLRDLALALDPLVADRVRLGEVVRALGWERAKNLYPEARRTLQRLGTDVIRHGIDPDTWIDLCLSAIDKHNANGAPVVVPDVRFPNEVTRLRQAGARLWRVDRPDAPAILAHESEGHADTLPADLVIHNDHDLTTLYNRVDDAITTERTHP